VSRRKEQLAGLLSALAALAVLAAPAAADLLLPLVMNAAGETLPGRLPRSAPIPVSLGMGFSSEDPNSHSAPELNSIRFELSPNVRIDGRGIPRCNLRELLESYEGEAACSGSLVGDGTVRSEVALGGEAPVAVEGRLDAFYGYGSHLLAKVVTGEPLPLVYVIPFSIERGPRGTVLVARHMHQGVKGKCISDHPNCFAQPYAFSGVYGQISYFRLFLDRRFRLRGAPRSFVRASCPASQPASADRYPLATVTLHYYSEDPPREDGFVGHCRPTA
jgi:hypothetical protein